jgi:acetyl esterase/lipase
MKNIVLSLLFILQMFTSAIYSQRVIQLYQDSIPNSKSAADEEITEYKNGVMIISKISKPTLTVFLPAKNKANGTAVIICPGGGYWVVAAGHEGADVAKKFNEMGVAAFVLKYRIPNDAWMINREIGPLQDAQQAIKMVRDNAAKWNVNPARIGIMGFSAGGHLAATAGTHFNTCHIPNKSNTSVCPNFMMLIYPVISFMPGISYAGSGEQILGKNPSLEKLKLYSNELQVTSQTSPTFLVHASDDDGVSPKNSTLFYDSLVSKKVPAEIHIYQTGGHGFGMYIKDSKELWMDRCKNWMQINGWLKKQKQY